MYVFGVALDQELDAPSGDDGPELGSDVRTALAMFGQIPHLPAVDIDYAQPIQVVFEAAARSVTYDVVLECRVEFLKTIIDAVLGGLPPLIRQALQRLGGLVGEAIEKTLRTALRYIAGEKGNEWLDMLIHVIEQWRRTC